MSLLSMFVVVVVLSIFMSLLSMFIFVCFVVVCFVPFYVYVVAF